MLLKYAIPIRHLAAELYTEVSPYLFEEPKLDTNLFSRNLLGKLTLGICTTRKCIFTLSLIVVDPYSFRVLLLENWFSTIAYECEQQ